MRNFFAHTFDLLLKGLAAAGGFLAAVSGNGSRRCVILLAVLMVADYISGVVATALGRGDHSSRGDTGWKSLLRKGILLLTVVLAYAVDLYVNQGNDMFLAAAVWFHISNEALSLAENLALCGVPIPGKLKNALESFSRKAQKNGPDS